MLPRQINARLEQTPYLTREDIEAMKQRVEAERRAREVLIPKDAGEVIEVPPRGE
jgi:hypothetical protein